MKSVGALRYYNAIDLVSLLIYFLCDTYPMVRLEIGRICHHKIYYVQIRDSVYFWDK